MTCQGHPARRWQGQDTAAWSPSPYEASRWARSWHVRLPRALPALRPPGLAPGERKGKARTGPRIQGHVSREAMGAGWAWGLRAGVWVEKVFTGNDGPSHTLPADSPVDPGPIRGQAPTPEGRRQGGAGPALLTSPTASHTAAQDRLPLSNLQPSCCSFCPDLSRRPQQ